MGGWGDAQVAEPLSHARDVTLVSTGGSDVGASRLTGEVVRVMAQVPPAILGLTGIDLAAALQRVKPGASDGVAARAASISVSVAAP